MRLWVVIVYAGLIIISSLRINELCEGAILGCEERLSQQKYKNYLEQQQTEENPIDGFKDSLVEKVRSVLPSPHSELILGMTLGIDKFSELPIFSEMLRETGTIHVVVVSGYNVTLVFTFLIKILGTMYSRRNFLLALLGTFFYSIISGFDPPVVRAWLMGSLLMFGKYYGLRLNMTLVMIFSALLLISVNPSNMFSLSFKLSFVATMSLVLFDGAIFSGVESNNALFSDLKSTLAAQVLIWPVISYYFGTVSLISPIVNALVLWTVPIATVLGSVFVVFSFLPFSDIILWATFFPLDFFVRFVEYFSLFKFTSISYQMGLPALLFYYFLVFIFYIRKKKA